MPLRLLVTGLAMILGVIGQPLGAAYVPERVFDTARGAFTDFEVMVADLSTADVVLVGEQHDDPNTHRLEQAILEGLMRRRVPATVSLEMFERDVQPVLDRYLSGTISEEEFLGGARPWPRYKSDYRALVEFAKAHKWPVVAANVPRRHAAEVAKTGVAALDALPAEERAHAARALECPEDAYYERFVAAMGGHAAAAASKEGAAHTGAAAQAHGGAASTLRYYWSQCLKDETMAESIAAAHGRRPEQKGPVVHFTGAFHSDFGTGTTERIRRRLQGRKVAAVTILPVEDIDRVAPAGEDLKRAEYLVYTTK